MFAANDVEDLIFFLVQLSITFISMILLVVQRQSIGKVSREFSSHRHWNTFIRAIRTYFTFPLTTAEQVVCNLHDMPAKKQTGAGEEWMWVGGKEAKRGKGVTQRRVRATLCTNYLTVYLDSNVSLIPFFFLPFHSFSWEETCIATDSLSPSFRCIFKRKHVSLLSFRLLPFVAFLISPVE